jgi:SIR2-like domain
MSKCYVLGAGFSKAVAKLPTMRNMTAEFAAILQRKQQPGNEYRTVWGMRLLDFLRDCENDFFAKPCIRPGEQYSECTFGQDLEAIVSFIDLNLATPITALVTDGHGPPAERKQDNGFWPRFTNLRAVRNCLENYVYLALIEPREPEPVFPDFVSLLADRDVIVTLNYDLLVERELWRRRMWNPRDGYGVTFPPQAISSQAEFSTRIPIYKLHGSLNWESSSLCPPPVGLNDFYDDGTPIFPGYLADESPPAYSPYRGAHGVCWLMPSRLKQFDRPELLKVWEEAQKAITACDEVVVIGYSLPEADTAARLLLGTARLAKKTLTIVDRNVDAVSQTIESLTGAIPKNKYPTLEKYVAANDGPRGAPRPVQ